MTRKEFFFVLFLAILASFLSLLPTIWSYLKTPQGFWFAGFNFIFDPWDINVYIAAIRQGFDGRWLYQNPYDPNSGPLPIYFIYLFLGHLSRLFSLPPPLIYHLASTFLTIVFFLILDVFLAFFIRERNWRFVTLFLVGFGGGIGWFVFPKFILADFSFPDSTVFQTLHLPQFILNQTLLLAVILFSFLTIYSKSWRFSILASLSGFFLASVHPYSLLMVAFVLLGYICILYLVRRSLTGGLYLIPQFILWGITVLFFWFILGQNPLILQNISSPSPWYLFVSYGLLSLLAIWGLVTLWRQKSEKSLFLFSWLIFQFAFLYLPFSFQRLTIKGFFIILCIAAVAGLKNLGVLVKRPWPIYFWVLLLSTIYPVSLATNSILVAKESNDWVYLTKEEKEAFDFLLQNTQEGENVLASSYISNFVPANTRSRVYFGHNLSVARARDKEESIIAFYAGGSPSSALKFLQKEKISYVFWGPEEKDLGDIDLTQESYLENIYQNGKVMIFKVK